MSARAIVGLVGAALVLGALIFGFSGTSRDGYPCGSVFSRGHKIAADQYVNGVLAGSYPGADSAADDCSSALSDRKPTVYAGLGIGAVLFIAAAFVGLNDTGPGGVADSEDGAEGPERATPWYRR